MTASTVDAAREVVMERRFDAPPALLYQAYTDPLHMPFWYGPKGFTITPISADVRVGGHNEFIMHAPDGTDFHNYKAYTDVVPNERLAFDYGNAKDDPNMFKVVITFEADGDGTLLRQRSIFPTVEACEAVKSFGAVELGHQTLDKLADRLRVMGLSITRVLDAPRDLVWQAWTTPEALGEWWGPKGMALTVLQFDMRPGGLFVYRMKNGDMEMFGRFRFVEIDGPGRLVWVNSFADAEGNIIRAPFAATFPKEILNVITLTERDGKTTMNIAGGPLDATPDEVAFYKGMEASMQQGFKGTFEQLEAYLAKHR